MSNYIENIIEKYNNALNVFHNIEHKTNKMDIKLSVNTENEALCH